MPDAKARRARSPSGLARQEANINRILDAFERTLLRDGIYNLGANAVMKEAGLAKPMLYKYFGGLPGLVREWGRRRPFWPTHEELEDSQLPADTDPKERLKRRLVKLANVMRERPLILEVLTAELAFEDNEVLAAFAELHARRGDADQMRAREGDLAAERSTFRLVHVMFAAIAYFALRSRRKPNLQGIHLDTEEGWDDTLRMIEEIIDDSILATNVRRLTAAA